MSDSPLLECLISTLNQQSITYCHWKSNLYLRDSLAEHRDVDLLVDRKDVQRIEGALASLGFKRIIDPHGSVPSVFHFYGRDSTTCEFVHVHVYYRIVTGESLLKNYCFPLEELYLQNRRWVDGMALPERAAELMLFVVRTMVKHASLAEYLLLLRRGWSGNESLQEELDALVDDDTVLRCSELLVEWLPSVDPALFSDCLDAIRARTPLAYRLWLAFRLRRQLKVYDRFSLPSEIFAHLRILLQRAYGRWRGRRTKQFAAGGRVIAFVGPEATGKSTLVTETVNWLGEVFDIGSVHLGKPPSTWLTRLPNLAAPLLRKLMPRHRMSQLEDDPGARDASRGSLLYSIRSILVAWDRYHLAVRLHRQAANGRIIICDRYPSAIVGAMDSARLRAPARTRGWGKLLGYFAKLENRIYRQMPPPDVVIRLTVPVEVAIERNREREKEGKEAEAYVRRRHNTDTAPEFPAARIMELDTNQSKLQTIRAARLAVWDAL